HLHLSRYCVTSPLLPLPTRRSSDLLCQCTVNLAQEVAHELDKTLGEAYLVHKVPGEHEERDRHQCEVVEGDEESLPDDRQRHVRSEEHTSELQSRENLVCRLLLEKK